MIAFDLSKYRRFAFYYFTVYLGGDLRLCGGSARGLRTADWLALFILHSRFTNTEVSCFLALVTHHKAFSRSSVYKTQTYCMKIILILFWMYIKNQQQHNLVNNN